MASENFKRALALTLSFEGGYSDHPLDPGGATNLGITRATLASHRGKPVSKSEVMALSRREAAAIYHKVYWTMISGDLLPVGVDLVMFDFAVNSGGQRAMRALRAALGLTQGAALTCEAVAAAAVDPDKLIRTLSAQRLTFLRQLPIFRTFGRGWRRRVAEIEAAALALRAERPGQSVSA